jgi:hypothetical protein
MNALVSRSARSLSPDSLWRLDLSRRGGAGSAPAAGVFHFFLSAWRTGGRRSRSWLRFVQSVQKRQAQ